MEDIFFEDFSLSSIAVGCEVRPSTYTGVETACGVQYIPGIYIFTQMMNGCNRKAVDGKPGRTAANDQNMVDENNNALCYHNPTVNYNMFNS